MARNNEDDRNREFQIVFDSNKLGPLIVDFLKTWTPTDENPICECAGQRVCCPCVSSFLVKTLWAKYRSAQERLQDPSRKD